MGPTLVHSIWTALLLVIFIGIVVWAWSGGRQRGFEEAARMPLDDDRPRPETARAPTANSREPDNG